LWLLAIFHDQSLVINYHNGVNRLHSLFYQKLWLFMLRFEIQRSKTIGNRLHYFENILSQVVTLEIWNSTFKNIGNRLHVHGNRLLLCKTIIKLFWASGNRLLPYGNRLPESKNSGKRFFFEKFFWKNCVIQSFLWKILLYLSWCFSWGSCISWVFSWIFTWIFLISLILFEKSLASSK